MRKTMMIILLAINFKMAEAQNVGVGKTNPNYKLDISGSVNTDSVYRIRGYKMISLQNTGASLFIGPGAGDNIDASDAYNNTFVGVGAGQEDSIGINNSYFGRGSGNKSRGTNNSFFGHLSGFYNKSGDGNTFIGTLAGSNNTTSHNNVFVGEFSGNANAGTGSRNTAVGTMTSTGNLIGTNNSFFGYGADVVSNAIFGISNSTALGSEAWLSASNQVRIGNADVTSIGGYVGWSNLSDGRFKKNIKEDVKGLEFIQKLRPVTYNLDMTKLNKHLHMKDSAGNRSKAKESIVYTGFIAQEVEQAAKETNFVFSGVDAPQNSQDSYALRYAEFTVPLVKAVQELAKQNEELRREINEIRKCLQQGNK